MRWTRWSCSKTISLTTKALWCFIAMALIAQHASLLSAQGKSDKKDKQAEKPPLEDVWQIVFLGEQRVGYGRIVTRQEVNKGKPIIHTRNELHFTLKRFGQQIRMETLLQTEETLEGDLLRYDFEIRNPPADPTISEGTIQGNRLTVKSTVAGRVQTRSVPWEAGIKSPLYQDRSLQSNPLKPGEVRSYQTFLPELQKVATLKLSAHDFQSVKLYDGKPSRLLKVQILNSAVPTMVVKSYLDENGESLKSESDLLGMALTTYTVPREVALEEIKGSELDVAVGTLIPVTGFDKGHDSKKVVYRITAEDVDLMDYIPEGDSQKVEIKSPGEVELTVSRLPAPKSSINENVADEFLKGSEFVQIDDQLVREHALKATAGESDQWRKAVKLEKYIHEKLTEKNFSTALASAAEVAKRMEGDCTEHAVLLAALLRVNKIPSRVAVGLVYAEGQQSFAGHMWTEAYFGNQWIPLDATLGRGGIGGAHIKLADASLSDDSPAPVLTFLPLLNVLGKMKIEILEQD
ncbi:MAG: transglutaminase-like domain-containing protein [Planctomycetaceae bacterium]